MINIKKVCLLATFLIIIASSALANTQLGFNKGILTNATYLNIKEAYILNEQSKKENEKDALNYLLFTSFERGVLGILLVEESKDLEEEKRVKLLDCLFNRPIEVYHNYIFKAYEEGNIDGNLLYIKTLFETAKNQCLNK